MTPQQIRRYFKLQNQNGHIRILMSKILMRPRFNHDQNVDVKNFEFMVQNQNDQSWCQIFWCGLDLIMIRILTSKILLPPRFDQDQNLDIEFFVAPKRNPSIDWCEIGDKLSCIYTQEIDSFQESKHNKIAQIGVLVRVKNSFWHVTEYGSQLKLKHVKEYFLPWNYNDMLGNFSFLFFFN
jgi:hypothetical protein